MDDFQAIAYGPDVVVSLKRPDYRLRVFSESGAYELEYSAYMKITDGNFTVIDGDAPPPFYEKDRFFNFLKSLKMGHRVLGKKGKVYKEAGQSWM